MINILSRNNKRYLGNKNFFSKENTNKNEEERNPYGTIFNNNELENSMKNKNKSQKEDIIFNPNDKIQLFDFEYPKMKNINKEINISGNNFRLVKPEIGVIISNENNKQKKEGGFEYIKKYNKPSMNEYNQKLSYNSQNSNNLLSSYISLDNNTENVNNNKDEK